MNDLIGLEYKWGHSPGGGSGFTDCFQLSCEIRRRLNLVDHAPLYSWVYEQYTESTFTPRRLARFLFQSGIRSPIASVGDMVLVNAAAGALGTVTEHGIMYLGSGQRVILIPGLLATSYYFHMDKS
jgi:hypothetical protein